MNSVLVCIDIQNDFAKPDGALSVDGGMEIIEKVNSLRKQFAHVMWTQDFHPVNHVSFVTNHQGAKVYDTVNANGIKQVLFPPHCIQGTKGAELVQELDVRESDLFVKKGMDPEIDSYSCFFDQAKVRKTDADEQLKAIGAKDLYFVGIATDFCVKFSVLDAISLGYNVYVYEDCIRGVSKTDSISAIAEMRERGATIIPKPLN